ncbi:flagellin [Virgibacillus dakarensis]|uniref:Flagellin n=1 Tax=Lentibacillus populi TaxID=1827502 RepID=A0A9W5TWC3_9BACI|nr:MULTISPECIES: flagellin [Bacillaceae]MBT2218427.1 flagellin [Virgibacillus dakarensis]MTW87480.1 flagellin [Virgibacillus dakarensis]GGB35800.1 flagellin [Lentibacillus populi]
MIINHNIAALNTHRQLSANNGAVQNSLEKLSSGLKINKAGDDAAGLAISEKMRGQIRGLEMASKNAQDGISLIQTAEGALNETHSILQRMRELAVQSSNDTNTDTDRAELQKEANQLAEELTRIADNTEFNTQKLLDGNFKATFHIGANEGQNLKIDVAAMGANALGVEGKLTEDTIEAAGDGEKPELVIGGEEFTGKVLKNGESVVAVEVEGKYYSISDVEVDKPGTPGGEDTDGNPVAAEPATFKFKDGAVELKLADGDAYGSIDISTQETADAAITKFQTAIDTVSAERSKLGAVQNRLEHTINNLGASAENLTAAESRIRDVDYDLAAA